MRHESEELDRVLAKATQRNSWFTQHYVSTAIRAIGDQLTTRKLTDWISPYLPEIDSLTEKTVGLILAGNIPLVGFHDILSSLIAGFKIQLKMSSDDDQLIPHLLSQLIRIEPAFASRINYVDRLKQFDLIIATGSNNTSRYFEYYFKEVPYIIRKNRNSVAVIHGDEAKASLEQLGHDLFTYFGLGCRNVSKIYIPENYDLRLLFEAIEPFSEVTNHHKYHNNYDYNKSIYLVNGVSHLDNGFLLLKEDERLASPLAVAYYERYPDIETLTTQLNTIHEQIQCIVSDKSLNTLSPCFPLGQSQNPALDDYADGVNTLAFLMDNK